MRIKQKKRKKREGEIDINQTFIDSVWSTLMDNEDRNAVQYAYPRLAYSESSKE